ncbi:MAG: hypothetical protein A3B91_04245 [Candidatus Yanofskybacteria bacterium RIFCSPHIGHO2_02_FULL_41_29]|uniref:Uncharacterized protein n=1 Tax=Candidatus Yanofskybacteria bacterium RIFCSPHIGHO2_01_FULL_41_53 TaxID=1802663 RepID=A0A1F8EHU9_9BACT|nr:MAG: hypothetical protein A2650_03505 [Candidatus Yanofskybacteria bacterium RIFCSPHIGHO2_01_FULL_41_53]OGN11734.1 MAG: hypothetical protein A3B91_04245 [Candidatus Yanofskybacteria bacterium RIFCSPHIGHO2_02_FULL_41_29]OGN22888.1 MAG: hypothetical protein A2916_00700 [Candidatus Yanofskybacteria bacterium RIFCSPLOWO2_01_FULL_41_67]OGN28706.1 MAG: hypothetical protein A3H54_02300 [Candidatus Yanofskybacteria bacterium RIFCSPLOWO2_02_FULL_41_13]OGN33189.1 MAG: hypothetical protein A3F98_03920 
MYGEFPDEFPSEYPEGSEWSDDEPLEDELEDEPGQVNQPLDYLEVYMSEQNVAVAVAAVKPFVCHGEPRPGKPCTAKLAQSEAWVPALATVRKVVGRWPSVKDLADHIHCGRCAALGRKAGLRFYRYQQTVVEMENRRVERQQTARQAFKRYF